ncbi:MAG: hypothetical protein DRI46_12070 [Chloroflexi bacterium]|nr:MAG: hypothetical protein DRI46_12070 [Chloroflexota bacterium]
MKVKNNLQYVSSIEEGLDSVVKFTPIEGSFVKNAIASIDPRKKLGVLSDVKLPSRTEITGTMEITFHDPELVERVRAGQKELREAINRAVRDLLRRDLLRAIARKQVSTGRIPGEQP